jgi:hypothetical protein
MSLNGCLNAIVSWIIWAQGRFTVGRTAIVLIAMTGLGSVLYFSGFFEGFISGLEGHPGLPSCDASHGQSDVKRAFEGSPLAKTSGIAVIGAIEVKTISLTAKTVECAATASLSYAQQAVISYSFTNDPALGGDQYYVRVKLDTDTFKPCP